MADVVAHIVYVSTAKAWLSEQNLEDLLIQARDRNKRHGVTGMLIYGAGNFIQALEGDRESVTRIFESIRNDPRHTNVIKIIDFEDGERDFPDWSMAYAHEPHRERIEGCINILKDQRDAIDKLPETRFIRRLLSNFLMVNT